MGHSSCPRSTSWTKRSWTSKPAASNPSVTSERHRSMVERVPEVVIERRPVAEVPRDAVKRDPGKIDRHQNVLVVHHLAKQLLVRTKEDPSAKDAPHRPP